MSFPLLVKGGVPQSGRQTAASDCPVFRCNLGAYACGNHVLGAGGPQLCVYQGPLGLTATARTVTVFLVTSHITVLALRSACLTHGEWHVLECDVAASGEETEPSQRMEMVASTRAELEAGPFG